MTRKPRQGKKEDHLITRRQMLQRFGSFTVVAAGVLITPPVFASSRRSIVPNIIGPLLLGNNASLVTDPIDFETGTFDPEYNWTHSGDAPWSVVSGESATGTYSAKSGAITHNQGSLLGLSVDVPAGILSFYLKLSSETNYDLLGFYANQRNLDLLSGEHSWTQMSYPLPAGQYTFRWWYTKDSSVSTGQDAAWIDDISFQDIPGTCADCSSTCTATCADDCTGSCSGTCTATCADNCTGGCTGGSTSACSGCSGSCSGGCSASCRDSCYRSCSGTCSGGCKNLTY